MVERDVGGTILDERSITSQMNDECSRRCDRKPIMLRTTETIDLDPRSIFILQNDAPWNKKIAAIELSHSEFHTEVSCYADLQLFQIELSYEAVLWL